MFSLILANIFKLTFRSLLDLSRKLDFPLTITLAFLNCTSHGDGGSQTHVSSGSGSVDVSTVKSPNSTKPDSPGCLNEIMNGKIDNTNK